METSDQPEDPSAGSWAPPNATAAPSTGWAPPDGTAGPPARPPWQQPMGDHGPSTAPAGRPAFPPQQRPAPDQPYGQQTPYGQVQVPYGQVPYGQVPYGQVPYGQVPYGQAPYSQVPYGYARPARGPWAVPPPAGTPYHQMARTSLHRWWRPLAGTLTVAVLALVAMLGLYLVGSLIQLAMGEDPLAELEKNRLFSDETANLAFELTSLGVLIPVVLLAVWAVQRRPFGTVTSVLGRMRWRWLLTCSAVAAAACGFSLGVSALVEVIAGEDDPWAGMQWSRLFPAVLVIVALVPFQAAAEEYVFRGWLMQAVGAHTLETRTGPVGRAMSRILRTPWPAIVIATALFTAGHAHRGWALLDTALFGLMAGWLAVRTGGLEAPIALHVLNNLMAFSFAAAAGELSESASVTDAPWHSVVSSVAQLAAFTVLVLWLARRGAIQDRSPGEPAATTAGPDGYEAAEYGPVGYGTVPRRAERLHTP